jgi:hypothetical protein
MIHHKYSKNDLILLWSVVPYMHRCNESTKSSTGLKFRSIEDWFLWINIKELSIITGILLLDFTFIGLVIIFDPGVIIDPLTLAAAGYSFDSIGEVVSGRFETILSTKGGSLKEKISSMK